MTQSPSHFLARTDPQERHLVSLGCENTGYLDFVRQLFWSFRVQNWSTATTQSTPPAPRNGLPITERQLAFARHLALRNQVILPWDVQQDRALLSQWIDRQKVAASSGKGLISDQMDGSSEDAF